jgi:hypothetical protein
VHAAETTLTKPADFQLRGSVNTGTISTEGLEKSKLAHHAYEECHMVAWNEARILEIERNSTHKNHKPLAHIAFLNNPISHISLHRLTFN